MCKKFVKKALAAYKNGANRLIFGSDWRTVELAGNTPSAIKDEGFANITIEIRKEVVISERERELILGDNLKNFSKFNPKPKLSLSIVRA